VVNVHQVELEFLFKEHLKGLLDNFNELSLTDSDILLTAGLLTVHVEACSFIFSEELLSELLWWA